jgi:hypothetical protein
MTITQTALLTLTDQWQEKVKRFSDEAHSIWRAIPEEIREMPTTKGERSENLHGYAAGYAAARQELLRLLEVCPQCVGMGSIAHPTATTKQRLACWKCKGTGMAKTVEEMIKADLAKNPYYSGPVNCQKCGKQHWIGSDCPTNAPAAAIHEGRSRRLTIRALFCLFKISDNTNNHGNTKIHRNGGAIAPRKP